jgi:hypothetical protein
MILSAGTNRKLTYSAPLNYGLFKKESSQNI